MGEDDVFFFQSSLSQLASVSIAAQAFDSHFYLFIMIYLGIINSVFKLQKKIEIKQHKHRFVV